MVETPESNEEAGAEPEPGKRPSPKRGAIPTPKSEIEKAKTYTPPKTDEVGDKSTPEPDSK